MTLRYLLDTNICIRVIRDRPPQLRQRFNTEAASLCISDVVLYELMYGAEKSATWQKPERSWNASPPASTCSLTTARPPPTPPEIRAALERRRCVIGAYDLMIAGHARSRGMIVVTNNTREFERVDGLRC